MQPFEVFSNKHVIIKSDAKSSKHVRNLNGIVMIYEQEISNNLISFIMFKVFPSNLLTVIGCMDYFIAAGIYLLNMDLKC